MQISKQCLSFFRFRRQVCRSPPQPEADLLNVIWDLSGESISTECYLGPFWGIHFYWILFGAILKNPFLLNVIWDYSGETISKNQNMDYSGETIFKKTISGTILGKPFQRTKRWTILGKPFLKTNIWDHSGSNFQPHYHTQAPVVRQNLEPFLGTKS